MHFTATLPRGFHSVSPAGLTWLALVVLGAIFRVWLRKPRAVVLSWTCWILSSLIVVRALMRAPSFADWLQTFYLDKIITDASFLGGCTVFLFFASYLLW